ncbi:MAG: GntR family transcriptional regulator [Acidimicrobiales bacterium]|jgi:GntR family transcriptional regulator
MTGRARTSGEGRTHDAEPPSWLGDLSRAEGPLHAQIGEVIGQAIHCGDLQPGDRLPPERELAGWFGVNRLTLRQALSDLERCRLIRRSVGRRGGTFVAEPTVERDLSSFAGFSEQARRLGLTASARVLKAEQGPASGEVARGLEIPEGSPVFEVGRLRLANARPVVLESSSFPADRFTGMLEEPLDGSLYELLALRYDARPCRAVEKLEPVRADSRAAQVLGVGRGAPLLLVERVAFDDSGRPVEFARDLFRGDRTRMVVWSFDLPEH